MRQGLFLSPGESLLQIDWKLLSGCNYRCSYCFEKNKPAQENICLSKIFRTAEKTLSLEKSRFLFRFVGGEPSLLPQLPDIMEYILDKGKNVFFEIITNGSRKEDYFRRLFAHLPPGKCRTHISVHLEYAQKAHIAKILETIASLGQHAVARLMYHPGLKKESAAFARFLGRLSAELPFEMRINALRQPPEFIDFDRRYAAADFIDMNSLYSQAESMAEANDGPMFYDENERAWPMSHSKAHINGLCCFKDFICLAGANTIHIEPDMRWLPATCFIFAMSRRPFYDNNERLTLAPRKCPYPHCGCDANYIIPKFRDAAAARGYAAQFCRMKASEMNKQFVL